MESPPSANCVIVYIRMLIHMDIMQNHLIFLHQHLLPPVGQSRNEGWHDYLLYSRISFPSIPLLCAVRTEKEGTIIAVSLDRFCFSFILADTLHLPLSDARIANWRFPLSSLAFDVF